MTRARVPASLLVLGLVVEVGCAHPTNATATILDSSDSEYAWALGSPLCLDRCSPAESAGTRFGGSGHLRHGLGSDRDVIVAAGNGLRVALRQRVVEGATISLALAPTLGMGGRVFGQRYIPEASAGAQVATSLHLPSVPQFRFDLAAEGGGRHAMHALTTDRDSHTGFYGTGSLGLSFREVGVARRWFIEGVLSFVDADPSASLTGPWLVPAFFAGVATTYISPWASD